jgi:hypothetical protein
VEKLSPLLYTCYHWRKQGKAATDEETRAKPIRHLL